MQQARKTFFYVFNVFMFLIFCRSDFYVLWVESENLSQGKERSIYRAFFYNAVAK